MSTILSKPKGHTSVEKNIIEETKEEFDSEQEEMVLSPNQNYQINIINLPKSIYSLDETINQKIKNIKYEYESGLILNKLPVKDMLMEYKDFELHGKRANPIFARNLLNMINVINLIWLSVEKNVHTFHEMLKKYFNTKFSYLDDEFTDFVLAMPLQKATLMKVYEMSNPFPDITEQSILLNNLYLSLDKIKEYTLQEMSLSALFSKTNINDYIVLPNAIFYIRQKSVINKFRKLIPLPSNIKPTNAEREKKYLGFNELDYVVKVKSNDVLIEATNMINYVKKDNANNYLNEQIQFDKNTVHFFEFKTNGYKVDQEINDLIKKSKRYMNIFKTNVVSNFNFFEMDNDNYKCHYVYDENRDSTSKKLPNIDDKEATLIYSSPGNEISLLVTIQNKMQNEITNLKKEMSELNLKFNNMEKNLINLFKDSINPRKSFIKHNKDISSKIINFESELTESDKLEKTYLTFKSLSEKDPEKWTDLFGIYFKDYASHINEFDKKINNFFILQNNLDALLIIKNCLGKSEFQEKEVEDLKNLFKNLDLKSYHDMLYLSIKYVFFQINNENLLDCFSDSNDNHIHDMIIKVFEYTKYQKDNNVNEKEFIIIQVAILKQIVDIAIISADYSNLCKELLCANTSLKQFIIGCILLINAENDDVMNLIKHFLDYYEY